MSILHAKSQASLEFLGVLSLALLVFGALFVFILNQRSTIEAHNAFLGIKKIAKEASNVINVASLEGDGYSIKLSVPYYINKVDYNLTIINGSVKAEQGENIYESALFVEEVTGSLEKGDNTIKNVKGVIQIE